MKHWRKAVAKRAGILGGLVLLPTVAGFLGSAWWVLDLAAHFRVQYALGSLLLFGLAMLRPGRAAALPATAAVVNLACVVPIYLSDEAPPSNTPPLSVLSHNIHTLNGEKAALCSAIERSGADVVLLYEVSTAWLEALKRLDGYEILLARPAADNFGIAALARVPVSSAREITLSEAMVPSIELVVPWHGREIVLLGTHPLPPIDATTTALRNEQLAKVAVWSAKQRRPHVVLGDLNTTRWSAAFESLIDRGGLIDSTDGFDPTWPCEPGFLAPLGIPIDHALHSPDLTAVSRKTGAPRGSDHRPIQVSLTYAR